MIWATVDEVRGYLDDDDIPAGTSDAAAQKVIDRCARTLDSKVIRWPVLDDETGQAADEVQRGHLVAAVSECVKVYYEAKSLEASLGGAGLTEIIAAGGSVTAGKLSVSGGSKSGGSGGAKIGRSADRLPIEAIEALSLANLIGGSVASW